MCRRPSDGFHCCYLEGPCLDLTWEVKIMMGMRSFSVSSEEMILAIKIVPFLLACFPGLCGTVLFDSLSGFHLFFLMKLELHVPEILVAVGGQPAA